MAPKRLTQLTSFISLLLVQPVLRAGQAFRPVIEVNGPSPTLRPTTIRIVWRTPWKVSTGFPWPPLIMAHSALRSDVAPHHATPSTKCPPDPPFSSPLAVGWQVAGPALRAAQPLHLRSIKGRSFEVGLLTIPLLPVSPFPRLQRRGTIRASLAAGRSAVR